MVDRNIYLSIFIVGFVFAGLTLLTGQSSNVALTFIYLSIVLILLIRLIEEWQYYRSYQAPYASALFIVLPTCIAVGGSLLSSTASLGFLPLELQTSILNLNLDLNIIGAEIYFIFLNIFSLTFALPFFILIIILIRKYYIGIYPSIFIQRKKYPRELILGFNLIINLFFVFFWLESRLIEISSLIFVIMTFIFILQHFILKIAFVPFRVRRTPTRIRRTGNMRSNMVYSTSGTSSNSSPNLGQSNSQYSRASRSRPSNIQVVPGIGSTSDLKTEKLTPAIIASLTPAGRNLTKDDFRCIFCYEFPVEMNKKVVICPHCRHPAHEHELQRWLGVASICSRCNKPISNGKMIRVTGKSYKKVLVMFQQQKLMNN